MKIPVKQPSGLTGKIGGNLNFDFHITDSYLKDYPMFEVGVFIGFYFANRKARTSNVES